MARVHPSDAALRLLPVRASRAPGLHQLRIRLYDFGFGGIKIQMNYVKSRTTTSEAVAF